MEVIYPDSLVGTDSHTTMINGLGVVGWGVGGIEAEAVMLGQPIYMLTPEVVGFKLTGKLPEGSTATDLVLVVTQMLREAGVVGKFVEFYGPGLDNMTIPDRATIANMAPEYGATMGFFPVDDETLRYLRQTGRLEDEIEAVETYMKAQGLFRTPDMPDPEFQNSLELDMGTVEPSLAGPKRPQDRILLSGMQETFQDDLRKPFDQRGFNLDEGELENTGTLKLEEGEHQLQHGDVVIAAITSCTNTSNPSVMLASGLVAKKAAEKGLTSKPWVKTSLAPGSKVVTEYLNETGLMPYLEELGFYLVGYGCTTCIGNSGPLPEPVVDAIKEGDLVAASVLSGNRNFEGRINPHIKANYLASPPLVVAYALAGTVDIDLTNDPIGQDKEGNDVFLSDIWPTFEDITEHMDAAVKPETFKKMYDGIEKSNEEWNEIPVKGGELFAWDEDSTYIQEPPFFIDMSPEPEPISKIEEARVLVKVGDSVTTEPHLPGGLHRHRQPCGRVPDRKRGRAQKLQQLRLPPRQRPRDDAGHLRQHPPEKPARPRHRGGLDHRLYRRRGQVDLRGEPELQRGGYAHHRLSGHRLRDGQQPRLGGEGHLPARRGSGHRQELRAHPPQQPHRDGCAAATVQRGRRPEEPGADG